MFHGKPMQDRRPKLTAERLREVFSYNSETGVFTRRITTSSRAQAGAEAGCVWTDKFGRKYLCIRLDGTLHRSHRLAWLWVHGEWPKHHVDHIDGNGLNNSISNLREASHSENLWNRPRPSNNSSGYKGVCWSKAAKKWQAQITCDKKVFYLGLFETAEGAHAAYCAAATQHHGEFARPA